MFKRIIKGDFGYLLKKRNRVILITILFFVLSLGIILTGYLTTGTKKNLLTVVGILGCLPACKSAVSMIMYIRAKGCSLEAGERIKEHEGRLIGMYDMYFTSYKHNFAISHMIVENKVILGFTEDSKMDIKECTTHLTTMLKNAAHNGITITIVSDLDKYLVMLDNLNNEEFNGSVEKDDEVRVSLYEISL